MTQKYSEKFKEAISIIRGLIKEYQGALKKQKELDESIRAFDNELVGYGGGIASDLYLLEQYRSMLVSKRECEDAITVLKELDGFNNSILGTLDNILGEMRKKEKRLEYKDHIHETVE